MPREKTWSEEQLIYAVKHFEYWQDIFKHLGLGYKKSNIKQKCFQEVFKKYSIDISKISVKIQKHSDETKEKISKIRKDYIKANPGKNNWYNYKRGQKPISETIFEQALLDLGVTVIAQYMPYESDRYYQIDFAIVDSKIAFEVNGGQHYENGKLKPYYQERHDHFKSLGWTVHEIQYYEAINLDRAKKVIFKCLENKTIEYSTDPKIINYNHEKNLQKEIDKNNIKILEENIEILNKAIKFKNAITDNDFSVFFSSIKEGTIKDELRYIASRKVDRPLKEELLKIVWVSSMTTLAKQFGVVANSIKKWCKRYGIPHPPAGYWQRSDYDKKKIKSKMFKDFLINE